MTPRAWLLTAVVVVSNVAGNLLLSIGLKGPNAVLAVIGVALLIVWTLSRMTLMSWADLSYILPVTSVGYILTALAGKYLLAEQISGARWWGTLLIFAGMVVVGSTAPRTQS
jgi:uncharacterized membrane protein